MAQFQADVGTLKRLILVVTHHAPCIEGTSRPDQVDNPWTLASGTGLVDKEGWKGVETWVSGYTHYSRQLSRNGIKLVSYQRGYVLPGSTTRKEESAQGAHPHAFDTTLAITA